MSEPETCPKCGGTDIREDSDPDCSTCWCDDCGSAINTGDSDLDFVPDFREEPKP